VILQFNYEELTALRAGARTFLAREEGRGGRVLAPPGERGRVEALLTGLEAHIAVPTLADLRSVRSAVDAIVECLRAEMEAVVVATHAADERAVAAYFDFAHVLTVANRLDEMAAEMEAMIELVTGEPPTSATSHSFHFPE
jgi:hypothetical protein